MAAALAACCATAGFAQPQPAAVLPVAPLWAPHVDFELKPGSKRHLGEADLFMPLAQDGTTLLFGNIRARLDNRNDREGNFGLGVRRMLGGGWNVGGYGFFDRRRTENGSTFKQLTLGGELLGPDWDFRGNAYLPQGNRVKQVGAAATAGGLSTAALVGTSVLVTTTAGTTTIQEERALKGFDAEVGWRAPLFDLEGQRQLRLYLGAYRFSDSTMSVYGPRARAELQVADLNGFWRGGQVTLGAEWQHDKPRGSQAFVSVRVRLPLGGSGAGAPPVLNFQQRRMTEHVMRDVDIVSQGRTNTVVTSPEVVERTNAFAAGQNFVVLNSANTNGAALKTALLAAGANSTVVLVGSFATTSTMELQAGQTVMGAGTLTVRTASGRTASVNTGMATVTGTLGNPQGGGVNPLFTLRDNATLMGMTVNAIAGAGTDDVTAVQLWSNGSKVLNNVLTGSNNGVMGSARAMAVTAGSNQVISGNTMTATALNGGTTTLFMQSPQNALVSGNTFSAFASTPAFTSAIRVHSTTLLAESTGNAIVTGLCERFSGSTFFYMSNGTRC